ncbi:MAG TPA: hypothetical protein VGK38_10750 [Prolixibacteraceae bacterium]|jgi:hypothetical protein
MNLTKEELEYHLCDIGLEATMKAYHVTQKEIDSVLIAKAYGESDRYKYKEPKKQPEPEETILTPDRIQLNRVIKENYTQLRRYFVKDKRKLNNRANSKEDILHNSLLSVLKGDFVYISDDKTINLLRRVLKQQVLSEVVAVRLTKEKTEQFGKLSEI